MLLLFVWEWSSEYSKARVWVRLHPALFATVVVRCDAPSVMRL